MNKILTWLIKSRKIKMTKYYNLGNGELLIILNKKNPFKKIPFMITAEMVKDNNNNLLGIKIKKIVTSKYVYNYLQYIL